MTEWWSIDATGPLIGTAGAVGGMLGGLCGTVAGVCVPFGRAKRLVYATVYGTVGLAVTTLAVGVAALVIGQPAHVWRSLCMVGGIMLLSLLPGSLMLPVWYRLADRRRLDAAELRHGS